MDNNIQENVTQVQEGVSTETSGKKSGKKIGLIIGAVAVVAAIVVALVVLLGGAGNGKLEIEGVACSYSATKGIKNVEKVSDGVAVAGLGNAMFYPTSGEPQEIDTMDILDGKYPVAYHGTMRIGDNNVALTSYNVYGEFKTQFGATHESTKAELDKKDLVLYAETYTAISTSKGAIDWDDIEKDYEKIVSANSFDGIDYIDGAMLVAPDAIKISVQNNDVQAVMDVYSSNRNSTAKDGIMVWLAKGKAMHMLTEGEVDYVVEEGVYCQEGRPNTLYVRMYTSVADAEKIKENMGLKK